MRNRRPPTGLVLAAALALLAAGDRPRNRLAGESSPYLLLHAGNPVDWYPWGEEALALARREGRPIFLSVGYSTCYWCHVMEREAFSDPAIAELMNRWFVNIKVDREERPDLDEIYMTATQLLTGHGGWPNSVFLTPELEPFFAGTYFPIQDQSGRPGLRSVLSAVHEAWSQRRPQVEERAARVAAAVRELVGARREPAAAVPGRELAAAAIVALEGQFDEQWGGFGAAPKFPRAGSLMLLHEAAVAGDREAGRMVAETLAAMGRGAIYDQLGGGFHRYTLDRAWRVPHFEKMLYDNALLAELLVEVAAAGGGDRELERLARGTLDFVLRELSLENGGFKSALDAQTDGEEGAYYLWTAEELEAALGETESAWLAPILGFDGEPGFEGGRHALYLVGPLASHAVRLDVGVAELELRFEEALGRLRRTRQGRPRPSVDDKLLTDWNGMAIRALARAGTRLGEPRYLEAAARAARFVLRHLRDADGTLLHVWRAGRARLPAFLDDYAYLVRGLLALAEATGDRNWLAHAERLADEAEARLGDPHGGYFQTADAPDLLVRPKVAGGGAVPPGNAVMALGLLELAARTGSPTYRRRAERTLAAFAPQLERLPGSAPVLALAALRHGGPSSSSSPADDVVVATAAAAGGPAAGWRPLVVRLEIAAGWHVNANPASEEWLIPTAVAGEVRRLRYPPGEPLRFAFTDGEIAVYSGRTEIRGEASPSAAAVSVTYQACDDRRCLPPVTRELALASPP